LSLLYEVRGHQNRIHVVDPLTRWCDCKAVAYQAAKGKIPPTCSHLTGFDNIAKSSGIFTSVGGQQGCPSYSFKPHLCAPIHQWPEGTLPRLAENPNVQLVFAKNKPLYLMELSPSMPPRIYSGIDVVAAETAEIFGEPDNFKLPNLRSSMVVEVFLMPPDRIFITDLLYLDDVIFPAKPYIQRYAALVELLPQLERQVAYTARYRKGKEGYAMPKVPDIYIARGLKNTPDKYSTITLKKARSFSGVLVKRLDCPYGILQPYVDINPNVNAVPWIPKPARNRRMKYLTNPKYESKTTFYNTYSFSSNTVSVTISPTDSITTIVSS
jgi:hypothetical protein